MLFLVLLGLLNLSIAEVLVTLSFDDTLIEHYNTSHLLDQYGMKGTFYINSGRIGLYHNTYMTKSQIDSMYHRNHDITGHTITHPSLTDVNLTEADRYTQICTDKQNLENLGYDPISFAFPYGDVPFDWYNITTSCNYTNSRTSGGIETIYDCFGCPKYLTLPIDVTQPVRSISYRLANEPIYVTSTIASAISSVPKGTYGWIIFIFHHIDNDPTDIYSITPPQFQSILDWIRQQDVISVVTTKQIIETNVSDYSTLYEKHRIRALSTTATSNTTTTGTSSSIPTQTTSGTTSSSNTIIIATVCSVGGVFIIGAIVAILLKLRYNRLKGVATNNANPNTDMNIIRNDDNRISLSYL